MLNYTFLQLTFRKPSPFIWGIILVYLAANQLIYNHLSNTHLDFLLYPTQLIVEYVAGFQFNFLPEHGYVEQNALFKINKSCSGFTFFTVLTAIGFLIYYSQKSTNYRFAKKAKALFTILSLSYLVCIFCNSSRILLGIKMQLFSIQNQWFPHNLLHELFGILYFSLSVILFSYCIQKVVYKWNI